MLEACKVYSDSLLEHKESSQHHCAVLTVNMFSFSYYNLYYYYYYYTTTTTTANLCPGGQIKAERYQLYMVEYFIHNNNFLKLFLKLRGPYDSFLRMSHSLFFYLLSVLIFTLATVSLTYAKDKKKSSMQGLGDACRTILLLDCPVAS